MISLKPSCSGPSRLSVGTNTSSKAIVAVSEAAQPSFFSLDAPTPSPRSTIRNEIPWWPPSAVVFTAVTMKWARTPLVM
jgi:hypothetical protein